MPLYVNPKFMNERRWAQLAGLLTWVRANADILGYTTTPLLPASWRGGKQPRFTNDEVMPREPYGYAHWKGDAGLVTLRNPWIERTSYKVYLAAETGQMLQVVSVYPQARVYATNAAAGSSLDVTLAPYETIVLHIAPALKTEGLPDAANATGGSLTCDNVVVDTVRLEYTGDEQMAFGPDWTNLSSGVDQAARVVLASRSHDPRGGRLDRRPDTTPSIRRRPDLTAFLTGLNTNKHNLYIVFIRQKH